MSDVPANADFEDADDLDLSALGDEELCVQMHDDLYDGLADEIAEGTNILLERGWCIAWCGWQWDVPHPSVRLGLRAPGVPPEHRKPDARMQLRIQPDAAADTFVLTDHHVGSVGNHAPIPPLDSDDPEAALFVREHLFDDAPVRIPRDRWHSHAGAATAKVRRFRTPTVSGSPEASSPAASTTSSIPRPNARWSGPGCWRYAISRPGRAAARTHRRRTASIT